MSGIKAGCVVVTKFCGSESAQFGNYINYIDRESAVRNEYVSTYNLYNDYMGNPDKTTGIFSNSKMELESGYIEKIKNIFSIAQDNGSLMWQTVISFDNRWLKENGLFYPKDNYFDEAKIKEVVSAGVNRMLEKEHLQNAIWSGAVHYNTDNIHVHIATVEPHPMREMKRYPKYQYVQDPYGCYTQDLYGKWIYQKKSILDQKEQEGKVLIRYRKEPVLDEKGNQIYTNEYVGRFKADSIESCKSYVVNEIIKEKSHTLEINNIIRNSILAQRNNNPIAHDKDFVDKFLSIHNELVQLGKKRVWNYRSPEIKSVIPQIDELSKLYLQKYEPDEYRRLLSLIERQSDLYREAYGENKQGRLYQESKEQDLLYRLGNSILKEMRMYEVNNQRKSDLEVSTVPFTKRYIDRHNVINEEKYNSGKSFKDYREGKALMYEGKLDEAFEKFLNILPNDRYGMAKYRIGQLYLNTEFSQHNEQEGMSILKECSEDGVVAASYKLALIYLDKKNVYYNLDEGIKLLEKCADDNYSPAQYKLAQEYMNEKNSYYNMDAGMKMLEKSAANEFGPAQYKLAKECLNDRSSYYNPDKGVELLQKCEKKDFKPAKYVLGTIYMNPDRKYYDPDKGLKLLKESAEDNNQFAQVKLGVIYASRNGSYPGVRNNINNAAYYFTMAADNGNDYARHRLNKITSKKVTLSDRRRQYDLEKAMRSLKKSFDSEITKRRNIREYERLNKQNRYNEMENDLEN